MSEILWKLNQKYICKMRLDHTWIRKRKFTLPCTTSHEIVINSSSALVILTQSSFWPSYFHNWVLVSYFVSYYLLFTYLHKNTWPHSSQKVWKLDTILMLNFFQPSFSKVNTIVKKSKQISDITADSCKYLTLQVLVVIILNIF